ncbi:MAG: endonuclease/exonuclease/phosphatase family protein [Saprospiraceae bacterium]|nr:endonuclease/exonuclease/phosphatase family protein [Pyrinomonadaceae bacterium]
MRHKIFSSQYLRVLLLLFLLCLVCSAVKAETPAAALFTYAELTTLYDQDNLSRPIEEKLNLLLTTPFVDNSRRPTEALQFSRSAKLGEFLRVAFWNINRGLKYEAIEAAFSSNERFEAMLDSEKFPHGSEKRSQILEQASALRIADVIILTEVDWGIKRSEYRNIAAELAKHLGMNYAFGVQFVELSPIHLSRELKKKNRVDDELDTIISVDTELYKGLHGIAILSRFPLENVRLVPFVHQPYDWYKSEKKGASLLEKGKREFTGRLFLEETLREVRRGGRTTLLADIVDARIPDGRVTIAATHLENRTKSANRVRQLEELLETIKDVSHPVVMGGDMNTSSEDLTPTSLRRELIKRFGNPAFWIKKGVQLALGFGVVEDFAMASFSFGRKYADPTVRHIPFLSPNAAGKFFSRIEKFRFADGGAFDFRGDPTRSANEKGKKLANSNERGQKGFITTYQVKRPVFIVGKSKLDWIFVKPPNLKNPNNSDRSYRFAPHFGRTLVSINEAVEEDRISDHRPMIVDLPLDEPPLDR